MGEALHNSNGHLRTPARQLGDTAIQFCQEAGFLLEITSGLPESWARDTSIVALQKMKEMAAEDYLGFTGIGFGEKVDEFIPADPHEQNSYYLRIDSAIAELSADQEALAS